MRSQSLPQLTQKQRAWAEQFFPLAQRQAVRFFRRFHQRMSMDELVSAAYYGLVRGLARWTESEPPHPGIVVWWMRGQMWADAPWKSALARKMLFFTDCERDEDEGRFDPTAPEAVDPPAAVPETFEFLDQQKPTPRWLRILWTWHVEHDCKTETEEEELRRTLEEGGKLLRSLHSAKRLYLPALSGHIECVIRLAGHRLAAKEIVAAVGAGPSLVASALDQLVKENRVIRAGNFFDVPREPLSQPARMEAD